MTISADNIVCHNTFILWTRGKQAVIINVKFLHFSNIIPLKLGAKGLSFLRHTYEIGKGQTTVLEYYKPQG